MRLWKSSKLWRSPKIISLATDCVGSPTSTFWKRRSRALSFSIYFWYSESVVAPINEILPRAIAGFKILAASIVPSDEPAPIIVWISSINKITSFSSVEASSIIILIRFSNSPRYFVPASIPGKSSITMRLFCIANGTSPEAIRRASPSTTAVFPTPGSPTRHGLFFVFRFKIEIRRSISVFRPITGSSLLVFASATKSVPKKSNAGVRDSFFSCGALCANGVSIGWFIFGFWFPKWSSIISIISSIGPKIGSWLFIGKFFIPCGEVKWLKFVTWRSNIFTFTPTKSKNSTNHFSSGDWIKASKKSSTPAFGLWKLAAIRSDATISSRSRSEIPI